LFTGLRGASAFPGCTSFAVFAAGAAAPPHPTPPTKATTNHIRVAFSMIFSCRPTSGIQSVRPPPHERAASDFMVLHFQSPRQRHKPHT
jgi:hypothetical protein